MACRIRTHTTHMIPEMILKDSTIADDVDGLIPRMATIPTHCLSAYFITPSSDGITHFSPTLSYPSLMNSQDHLVWHFMVAVLASSFPYPHTSSSALMCPKVHIISQLCSQLDPMYFLSDCTIFCTNSLYPTSYSTHHHSSILLSSRVFDGYTSPRLMILTSAVHCFRTAIVVT
jgi:hypothetical protein